MNKNIKTIIKSLIAVSALLIATNVFIEFNFTESEPLGIYFKSKPLVLNYNDIVTFGTNVNSITKIANERHYTTRPRFMKTIMGIPGDRITILDRHLYINNELIGPIQAVDSENRPLPSIIQEGIIPPNTFFLASTLLEKSFDSRYFGLIPKECIISKVTPLIVK